MKELKCRDMNILPKATQPDGGGARVGHRWQHVQSLDYTVSHEGKS